MQGGTAGAAEDVSDTMFSIAKATTGKAGSEDLDGVINPEFENFTTADPSDVVEVTPNKLVNRNARGSTLTSPAGVGAGMKAAQEASVSEETKP